MATQYSDDAALEYWEHGDRNWDIPYANTCQGLDRLTPIGNLAVTIPTSERPTSASLNVRVAAGSYQFANGTIGTYAGTSSFACTTAATNYLYLDAAGTLQKSTSGWPLTAHVRLAVVVAGASTLTSIAPAQVAFTQGGRDIRNVPVRSVTSATTVLDSDDTIIANATGGAFNVTLPTAVGRTGRSFTVKRTNSGANAVTVATTSSQTVDGSTTSALSTQWASISVRSDGANWIVVAKV